jgi:hypothetical protein
MIVKFQYIQDPGHGWFAVTKQQAEQLGLSRESFSSWSYYGPDGTLYAEEDCDAQIVIEAHEDKFGSHPELSVEYLNHDAPLRMFARCTGRDD